MKDRDIQIDLGSVQRTLVLPLWGRAKEAEKKTPILCDTYARDIVARIDYDFSKIDRELQEMEQLNWAIRAYNFDNSIRTFLTDNKNAVVVNIGAGLDTTFQRIDNGSVLWINIDMPDAVTLRHRLIPDAEREMTIAQSVFDFTWMDDIVQQTRGRSILFMAAGVLFYFTAYEVEALFRMIAEWYPSAHFVFDAMPWFIVTMANWEIKRKKLMNTVPFFRWHLKKASHLKRWVDTIKVVEEYPMFSRVQVREDWSKKTVREIRIMNFFRWYNMVHVQF